MKQRETDLWRVVALGCALWCFSTALRWPIGPSFRDEVGYIGQSRLELAGTLRPAPTAVCYAFSTSHGDVAEYPPFIPTILIPLVAISPRAAFLLGALSALLLVLELSRALTRFGVDTKWSLVLLLHPTVIVLSRTAMGDLLLAAAAVGAWNAIEESRRFRTAAWFGLLVATKPAGVVLAAGLIGGSWLRRVPRPLTAIVGASAGLAVVIAMNFAATGGPRYATFLSSARFGLSFVRSSGWRHLMPLALLPPGLVLGAWPLWKRREFGALAAATALFCAMTFYYFVDSGRSPLESLVLAPRLTLPAVAILSVGWLALVDTLVPLRLNRLIAIVLLAGCAAVPFGIGLLHRRWQEPMGAALDAAEVQMALRHSGTLGVTPSAFKAGVMARKSVVAVTHDAPDSVAVILCSNESESYRAAAPRAACAFEGFAESFANGPYRVLVRQP